MSGVKNYIELQMMFMTTKLKRMIIMMPLFVFVFACNTNDTTSLKKELFSKFENDPEKKECASFLVNNFNERSHYEGKRYDKYIRAISMYSNNPDTLEKILSGYRSLSERSLVLDARTLSANDLSKEVDKAHWALGKVKWGKEICKTDFQNYILPYKINNAKYESWRDSVWADYGDTVFQFNTIQEAALYLIKRTSALRKDFKVKPISKLPDLPYSSLKKIPFGTCKELSDYITFVLRAYAIPCVQDFTPNYTNLWSGHYWNAIIDESGEKIPFVIPLEVDTLGHFKSESYRLGKVYRVNFEKNQQSHASIKETKNFLQGAFKDEFVTDVTKEYIKGKNISVPIIHGKTNYRVVYLTVYDNRNWKPISWGNTDENGQLALYKNVGVGSVYLPVTINKISKTYLNYPFVLQENGAIDVKYPNKDSLITLNITRKYPLVARIKYFINRMNAGYFEVAQNIDFKGSEIIYRIENLEGEYFQEVNLNLNGKYRFVRYMSPNGSFCNVAELEFYNANNDKLTGNIIANYDAHSKFPDRTKHKAFDGDVLTFFHADKADSAWIGMDLKKPQYINKIRFIPRNGNNIIVTGNMYEVFYWDYKWVSLGKKISKSNTLIYENVPSNALYFIHNHSGGKEERIFTYENGKQVWW